ncbi:beta-ketoacyl [acyl carrier protein] synthase domain-containing protein [Rhodococcoides kyotonense]|uniref:Mycobactin polyketide synthetase MbtC n=1 Tax=Rhodococcoides kyotonense TaxID=398843 RepID=A0A239N2Z1_9NOCA|nr:polyketide synthase [Rhodococcus kyotonensis]SNT49235.1 mycobactin polyketide synthetase MbtC [Rhodococcus kyotonensis]
MTSSERGASVYADDDIVVVGMAVEAPGGVETVEQFWDVLRDGRETIGRFPRDRGWHLQGLASLGRSEGWRTVPDAGGFLDEAADFDPQFFGITPREAIAMDPQQRVGLRVTWRALENSGIDPDSVDGDEMGCFMGAMITEYGPSMSTINEHNGYQLSGTSLSAVAGRISHVLGSVGPCLTVDTGCAASLTAVHLACSSIRLGECDWAVAGGVTVMGSEMMFVEFAKNNALSVDGHCRSYTASATGTVWSEGAGVVVLERVSRARELGHRIHGCIRGSATNHNGSGAALAVPRGESQVRLIDRTLRAAGVRADQVSLVEGHGTGTQVGDPIELNALARTYGSAAMASDTRVELGSCKSNFGHTQAAAGVLGLVKVLTCADRRELVPTLYADDPTDKIDWDRSGLRLVDEVRPWPAEDGTRHGAVSAFGIGGSNAHVVVAVGDEEYARA